MAHKPVLLTLAVLVLIIARLSAQSWISGEIVYRVRAVPEGSAGARLGLQVGDMLPDLSAIKPGVVAVYRLNKSNGRYEKQAITLGADSPNLGVVGDTGFYVTSVQPGSLGARAELAPGDFIGKINDTVPHSAADLRLVDDAYEKNEQVLITFTRWFPEYQDFKNAVSRRRFVK